MLFSLCRLRELHLDPLVFYEFKLGSEHECRCLQQLTSLRVVSKSLSHICGKH